MAETAELLLYNARVLTLDSRRPRARSVLCRDGRTAAISDRSDKDGLETAASEAVDCRGRAVIPGFIDSHTHFLAYASSLTSVDCGPGAVSSIPDMLGAIARRAGGRPLGAWIKATGYDEFYLAEKRHPTARDLDSATAQHPVRLGHRSGHACVLNSYAMRLAGITNETPEPRSGVIDRDLATGEPTGLFIDLGEWLGERLGASHEVREMDTEVRLASERYLSLGVTSLQDASVSNSLESWRLFQRLKGEGVLAPRVTMLPGHRHINEIADAGLRFGAGGSDLRVGHAKVILGQTTGTLQPSKAELRERVHAAASRGFPVAVHAVEEAEIEAAIDALEWAQESGLGPGLRHRIEHCSVCPPALQERLRRLGVIIVTQPAFLHYSGRRYLSQVPAEQLPWLYPIRSLRARGLRVAGSSDSPVAPPDPLVAIRAAVTRRSAGGDTVGRAEAVGPLDALEMYTVEGAYASSQEGTVGAIAPGMLADLIVLSDDPTSVGPEAITDIEVCATIVGGKLLWKSGW